MAAGVTAPAATLASPTRFLLALLRVVWRQRRCAHPDWTPLDGCPDCWKAERR